MSNEYGVDALPYRRRGVFQQRGNEASRDHECSQTGAIHQILRPVLFERLRIGKLQIHIRWIRRLWVGFLTALKRSEEIS